MLKNFKGLKKGYQFPILSVVEIVRNGRNAKAYLVQQVIKDKKRSVVVPFDLVETIPDDIEPTTSYSNKLGDSK